MEKSDFDKLLERYLTGQVSEQERIKIEAWLNVLKTEDTTDLELTAEEEDKLYAKITENLEASSRTAFFFPSSKRLGLFRRVIGIAASLVLMAGVSYMGWRFSNKHSEDSQAFASADSGKMILNDGTLVWLRGQSKLVYYEKTAEHIRYAELTGEALFEVAKDPHRPFVIKCGDVRIKVLGTSFNLKTDNDGLELKVLTGMVSVSSEVDHVAVTVEPNQKITYKISKGIEKSAMDKKDVYDVTANTGYNMQFSNTSLNEVVKGFERKFDQHIVLSNPVTGNCRVTADFTDHSLESSLQMITEVLDVEYTRQGNTITINGKGCQ